MSPRRRSAPRGSVEIGTIFAAAATRGAEGIIGRPYQLRSAPSTKAARPRSTADSRSRPTELA